MMTQTILSSIIAVLLFLLMLSRKQPGRVKALLGCLTAVSAAASLVLFLLMQHASGNPDDGMELFQIYLPCGAYLLLGLWGALTAALSLRRLKKAAAEKDPKKEREA